ncbi:MAG TPA: PIN domain-containing protein [Solirubrobacterales bacterium]|nr:PIN domain-containing protein [Solirubrobacterales bacterium]
MSLAYVDTSCLVAIAFAEPGARGMAQRLGAFDRLLSSNLLEAELRSALGREGVPGEAARPLLAGITWVHPDRPLTRELNRITAVGYLRGADLWHLACALFLAPDGRDLAFLTLDRRQAAVAGRLDFLP